MPDFVYYDLLNWFYCYYLIYAIVISQFCSWFLGSVLFSFVEYRWWSLITLTMFAVCLPVDVLIFYKEPLGAFGTLFVSMWVLIPFLVMVADAMFPEREALMVDSCKLIKDSCIYSLLYVMAFYYSW